MNLIKVVIVEDNPKFVALIRDLIEMESDIQICGEAESFKQAKEVIQSKKPDIVTIDISLDESNDGLKLLKELSGLNKSTKAIVLSAHDERSYAIKSFEAGAKGYLCKDKIVSRLIESIRLIHAGEKFISSDM